MIMIIIIVISGINILSVHTDVILNLFYLIVIL